MHTKWLLFLVLYDLEFIECLQPKVISGFIGNILKGDFVGMNSNNSALAFRLFSDSHFCYSLSQIMLHEFCCCLLSSKKRKEKKITIEASSLSECGGLLLQILRQLRHNCWHVHIPTKCCWKTFFFLHVLALALRQTLSYLLRYPLYLKKLWDAACRCTSSLRDTSEPLQHLHHHFIRSGKSTIKKFSIQINKNKHVFVSLVIHMRKKEKNTWEQTGIFEAPRL